MSVNKEVIKNIRNNILTTAQENSGLFHPKDVERIKTDDWAIERFVLVHKLEDASLKSIVKAMDWKMSFGVNDFTDDYFPEEIYKIGVITVHCVDREGRPIIWYRLNRHQNKSPEFGLLERQYLAYIYEKVDQCTNNQGWSIVLDATGSGLSNVELDFSKFMVEIAQNYYPRGIKYVAVIDLPWILNAATKIILGFMKEELRSLIKFHNKEELIRNFEPQFIPVHLGGTYEEKFVVPPGVKPL